MRLVIDAGGMAVALYVAVAADINATLVTLDARFAAGAARMVTVLPPADVPSRLTR